MVFFKLIYFLKFLKNDFGYIVNFNNRIGDLVVEGCLFGMGWRFGGILILILNGGVGIIVLFCGLGDVV